MKAGHESGRGHGPGGRLYPMKGDRVEMWESRGPDSPVGWTLKAVRYSLRNHPHVFVIEPFVPIYADTQTHWRWPHLTTLGIRGSFCCDEHGLIEPLHPLTTEPPTDCHGVTGEASETPKGGTP